jgi:hypothetical protein
MKLRKLGLEVEVHEEGKKIEEFQWDKECQWDKE